MFAPTLIVTAAPQGGVGALGAAQRAPSPA